MFYRILILTLCSITIIKSSYAQENFISWPDRTIRNFIRDFSDVYAKLDSNEYFKDFHYPLSESVAIEEMIAQFKQFSPNEPLLENLSAEVIKNAERDVTFVQRLHFGFRSIVRQRLTLEKYRYAYNNLDRLELIMGTLKMSWDSTRWHLYKYNNHPRTKDEIRKVENLWLDKTCCNYFKWHGDFLNIQNIFENLNTITYSFKLLAETDFDIEGDDFDFEEMANYDSLNINIEEWDEDEDEDEIEYGIPVYMPNNPIVYKSNYYLVNQNYINVTYLDIVKDVDQCLAELNKLSTELDKNIADTLSMERIYSQNKVRWQASLEFLHDSLNSSKTILEDSIRSLRKKQFYYQRKADSISILLNSKRREKDTLTNIVRALSAKVNDSISEELFFAKLRRDLLVERDAIYQRCEDPNCKDDLIILELNSVSKRIDRINSRLDSIGLHIDNMQNQKVQFITLLSENTKSLQQIAPINSEILIKLSESNNNYKSAEEVFFPIISNYNDFLFWVEEITNSSNYFFALNFDKEIIYN